MRGFTGKIEKCSKLTKTICSYKAAAEVQSVQRNNLSFIILKMYSFIIYFYFFILYVFPCVSLYHMCLGPVKRVSYPLDLQLQVVVSHLIWMLGIEARSSSRVEMFLIAEPPLQFPKQFSKESYPRRWKYPDRIKTRTNKFRTLEQFNSILLFCGVQMPWHLPGGQRTTHDS